MRVFLLVLAVGLSAAQKRTTGPQKRVVTINRDEIEYRKETPCPIDYVEPDPPRAALLERLSEGYKICKKGNIANCPAGSTFYMDERNRGKCQFCTCSEKGSGGLYTARCNKIDCDTLPKSTPTPGNGALQGRAVRQNCRRTQPKVCKEGCSYMARYRNCVYCDCENRVDFTKAEFQV
ncbi:hypothetical protein FJT64_021084 [Amphibalanus amphitrite]|uniref:Uncharacterized protein n=1 Tax=Amphibalanus amphitrite TaxID=1232801 RepID=A0A6A4WZJ6_AMPAM|nr:uncharacterized protein LOC122371369 [Amphibalanus amphitrite]XP_043218059.1 uncharacterized protein LOC122379719 [Amphibalanus amphitrite]KAF0307622.1 hypothetical protein FJT64_021084 [Amphibalanus amphitrite]